MRLSEPRARTAGLHYQVAQATSLENVEFLTKKGTKQRGIYRLYTISPIRYRINKFRYAKANIWNLVAENRSSGIISDISFRGGGYGFYMSNLL